jgi:hypothetical protein
VRAALEDLTMYLPWGQAITVPVWGLWIAADGHASHPPFAGPAPAAWALLIACGLGMWAALRWRRRAGASRSRELPLLMVEAGLYAPLGVLNLVYNRQGDWGYLPATIVLGVWAPALVIAAVASRWRDADRSSTMSEGL